VLALYNDQQDLVYCGRVGTGFTDQSLKSIHTALKKLDRAESSLAQKLRGPEARGVHWVEPRLVAEVEYTERTEEGILRHPSFKGLREDKPADEVHPETPEPTPKAKPAAAAARKRSMTSSSGDSKIAGVQLSNPDKVLYPDQGVTKLDLAHYYESIADHILPYVAGRPLSLVRCPMGRQAKCFFQKHVKDSTPPQIHPVKVQERSGIAEYIGINDLSGLIALVQMGVLEIHPWGSRADKVDYPDQIIFDLDPDPSVTWEGVVTAALELKELLESFEYQVFVKTSGGKGLHIVMPVTRHADWNEVKAFSKAVAEEMVRRAPDRYIATMSKAKRVGKIFVDYLRNGRGATSVAAYSSRARQGAPVSAPIFWEELTPKLSPQAWNVENLPARLKTLKKDPWAEFFSVRQSITANVRKTLGMKV
jgi:bifunctional non-homologous end joining protein LigD